MTQSAHIKTPFEAGYRAYTETAMRLVEHELTRLHAETSNIGNAICYSSELEKLSAIKCGLQIAIDNMNNDYTKEYQAIEYLGIANEKRAIRFSFGSKAD